MKLLTEIETREIGAGFKLHFNIFMLIGGIAAGAITGGPFGVGIAIGTALIAQSSGNLTDMYIDEFGHKHKTVYVK